MASGRPQKETMRVAIIGAGLGGLVFALFLKKYSEDIIIDIYEAAHELKEVGAGIGMWPRIWEVMEHLGLQDQLVQITGDRNGDALPLHLCKGDEAQTVEIRRFQPALRTFHRADLQTLFARNLQSPQQIRFSKRLKSYVAPPAGHDPILLQFEDGTTATCDVLVGSDGIRSIVRRTMYGEGGQCFPKDPHTLADPVWSGQIAFRGLVSSEKLSEQVLRNANEPVILTGKYKSIMHYPICQGEVTNVVAFVRTPDREGTPYEGPWVSETSGENVAKHFSTWDPQIQELLKAMEHPLAWAVHTVPRLPTFVKGRVVLIGDAAHAMTPHQGAGAGQAMEDGCILATILASSSVTLTNLPDALKMYDEIRRPFSQEVQRRSDTNGTLYHLDRLGWEDVTPEQSSAGGFPGDRLLELATELERATGWLLKGSILQDREQVLQTLEQF